LHKSHPAKEIEMSANRLFVLMIAVALAVVAALVVRQGIATKASSSATDRLSDYALRHPDVSIPVTGQQIDTAGSDYFQRHPELAAAPGADTTDYAARHPEFSRAAAQPVDCADYYFRDMGLCP
jgi:hypothetical protein